MARLQVGMLIAEGEAASSSPQTDVELKESLLLQLSPSNYCNLSCRHCYRDVRQAFADEWSLDELRDLMGQFRALADVHDREPVVLLSGGEPLAWPHLEAFAEEARTRGILLMLNSNATLATPELAADLKRWNVEGAQVSLDGPDAPSHDHIRGRGSFERTLTGIRNLLAAGLDVSLKVTLMAGLNDTRIADFYDLANRERVSVISFARLVPLGPGAKLAQLTPDAYRSALEAISEAAGRSPYTLTMIKDAGFDRAFSFNFPHLYESGEGTLALTVDADGTAYASRRAPIVLGNLRETSLAEIWNHPILNELRIGNLKGKCARCDLLGVCFGGSRAAAYAATGDYLAPDPGCWVEPASLSPVSP